jgi:hypothetical protein
MPRKKFSDKRRAILTDGQVSFLRTGEWVPGDAEIYFFKIDDEKVKAAWESVGADLTAECIKRSPGTRPYFWWVAGGGLRLRVGGRGTLRNRNKVVLDFGVPRRGFNWIIQADVRVGINAIPLDPENMPTYESQAAYLQRFGLFVSGEEKRIPAAAFEPEAAS